jgi:hypothetical protein
MSPEWYLAELVMKITVTGDDRSVVHQNLTLVKANSPDEAFEKATSFGKAGEASYPNPEGKAVQISFQGISDLTEVYEDLEDGAEIAFRETVNMPEDEIRDLIPTRDRLPAFQQPGRTEGPDYASGEIVEELEQRFGIERPQVDRKN